MRYPKDHVAYARVLVAQINPDAVEAFDEIVKLAELGRREAVQGCVAWLAKHAHDYKPECLAEAMARDLLQD
jgi:hypothetical protein